MNPYEKVKIAYEFFCRAEEEKRIFTLQELMDETGWSSKTVKTYLTKKWRHFLTRKEHGFLCHGVKGLPEEGSDRHVRLACYPTVRLYSQMKYLMALI